MICKSNLSTVRGSSIPFWHVAVLTKLSVLLLRVLYRLRFLSEQAALDVETFSYLTPLVTEIFTKGAIGLTEEDDPLEQAALALDIVKFHSGECMSHSSTFIHTAHASSPVKLPMSTSPGKES